MKTALKSGAEKLLVASGMPHLAAHRSRTRALILAYHNIVPDGEPVAGERSLHLPQRAFAAQLDILARYCEVVPLDAVLRPTASGGMARPRVAITFDDGYHGAVTAGADELAIRGMPATIFVAPGFIDGRPFWWDSYSSPESGTPPPRFRDIALRECNGIDSLVRRTAIASGIVPVAMPRHARMAAEDDLSSALRRAPMTLGCHTWSHANLAGLSGSELAEELRRPRRWLRERFDHVSPWLSYPYGLSSSAVHVAAGRAGYAGGLRIGGGWLSEVIEDPFAIPRLNVPSGLSNVGFTLRVSGVFSA